MNSSPTTHAIPSCTAFPAMQICVKRATSPRGGHLPPVETQYRGHFLFRELADNLAAHGTNPNEAAVVRPAASGRARRPNRRRSPAKSRPSVFPVVDHVAHSLVSSVSPAHNSETKGTTFACTQKGFARS
jgi:hypothetical protein